MTMAAVVVCRFSRKHWLFARILTHPSPYTAPCLNTLYCNDHRAERSRHFSSNGRQSCSGRKANPAVKFRQTVTRFANGSKQLWFDVLRARKLTKKVKTTSGDSKDLTREEMQHLIRTKKAVAKTFPVVVGFFVVPFVGYAFPIIAYVFPKQLLSHHFWTPQMQSKFTKQDHIKRSLAYKKLAREVGLTSIHELKDTTSTKDLLKICEKVVDEEELSNEELLKIKDAFDTDSLHFQKLPRYHLTKLSRSWLIRPWLPTGMLRHLVRKRLEGIQKDDAALLKEGVHCLSEEEIKHACHSRGLDVSDKDIKELSNWLQEWVELSNQTNGKNPSFLAHSAIFKAAAFSKQQAKELEDGKHLPEESPTKTT